MYETYPLPLMKRSNTSSYVPHIQLFEVNFIGVTSVTYILRSMAESVALDCFSDHEFEHSDPLMERPRGLPAGHPLRGRLAQLSFGAIVDSVRRTAWPGSLHLTTRAMSASPAMQAI